MHRTETNTKAAAADLKCCECCIRQRNLASQPAWGLTMRLDDWFEHCMSRAWAYTRPATQRNRRGEYRLRIQATFGQMCLSEIHAPLVEDWLHARLERDGNRACVQRAFHTLRDLLTLAVRYGLLYHNPVHAVRYPSHAMSRKARRVLAREDYMLLVSAASDQGQRTIVRALCEAGLRVAEAIELRVGDLDLAAASIRVERRAYKRPDGTIDVDTPKSRRTRVVAISGSLAAELKVLTAQRSPSGLVWMRATHRTGHLPSPYTAAALYHTVRRLGLKGGVGHVTPHMLRATGASLAMLDGVSPLIVREQLGHASLRVTDRHYLHVPDLRWLSRYSEAVSRTSG